MYAEMHRKNKVGAQIYLFSSLGIKLQFAGWCGRHKDPHIDQGSRIEFRPQLIFNKDAKACLLNRWY